jgi:signal transduction histidine kinase
MATTSPNRLSKDGSHPSEEYWRDKAEESLALVAHELKSPLAVIRGTALFARSRQSTLPAEDLEDLLTQIDHESNRMSRLIEALILVFHVRAGEGIDTEPLHLERLIRRAVEDFQEVQPRGVAIQIDPDFPFASAEARFVQEIVRNLLENAAKFSDPDSPISWRFRPRVARRLRSRSATTVAASGRKSWVVCSRISSGPATQLKSTAPALG